MKEFYTSNFYLTVFSFWGALGNADHIVELWSIWVACLIYSINKALEGSGENVLVLFPIPLDCLLAIMYKLGDPFLNSRMLPMSVNKAKFAGLAAVYLGEKTIPEIVESGAVGEAYFKENGEFDNIIDVVILDNKYYNKMNDKNKETVKAILQILKFTVFGRQELVS